MSRSWSRRRALRAGVIAACTGFAGCSTGADRATPASETPTNTETKTETTSQQPKTPIHPSCETPTPEPAVDLGVINRSGGSRSVTVIVSRTSSGETVFQESATLEPEGDVEWADVFPADGTYRIEAELPNGTSRTEEIEATADDRYAIILVAIQEDDSIEVGRLNVVPEPTPTPCPQ